MSNDKNSKFERELSSLINRYSKESESNTPDYILAKYLVACLNNYNQTIQMRTTHKRGEGLDFIF